MNCKKILALLLTLVMLVTVLPMGALTVSAESTTEFLGGDGTEESPYLISNKTHLNNTIGVPTLKWWRILPLPKLIFPCAENFIMTVKAGNRLEQMAEHLLLVCLMGMGI